MYWIKRLTHALLQPNLLLVGFSGAVQSSLISFIQYRARSTIILVSPVVLGGGRQMTAVYVGPCPHVCSIR